MSRFCLILIAALLPHTVTATEPLRVTVALPPVASADTSARVFTAEGFEADLARDIGKALGRPVIMVGADADIVVQRGAGVPVGYAPAISAAMRSDTTIRDWADLKGRTVCVTDGSPAARLAAELGADVLAQPSPALSLMLVRTGDCDAALHEAAPLAALFRNPEWAKFSATLPPREAAPLTLAVTPSLRAEVEVALTAVATPQVWQARSARWARNVALEVWLEQDAPDCH